MTIRYEANPPKVGSGHKPDIDEFIGRLRRISRVCDGVHITENVLGITRVSPICVGRRLREFGDITMTLSMRVRDKTALEVDTFAANALDAGFSGILVVAGDRSTNSSDRGQTPSGVVRRLYRNGTGSRMDLYLSIPGDPDYARLGSKLRAHPKGFVTQVIQDVAQVESLAARLPSHHIMPILLFPSPKNQKSADFLGIDMARYSGDFSQFVGDIHHITGDVLLTSPGDYAGLYRFLSEGRLE